MSWNDAECDVCSKPWEIHLRMGCVHEHIGDVRLCEWHRMRLIEKMICIPCVNDHGCPLGTVEIIEDRDAVSA